MRRLMLLGLFAGVLALVGCSGTSSVPASKSAPPTGHAGVNGMIAFTKVDPSTRHSEVYVMNPDGSHVKQLTSSNVDNNHPIWSSDGSTIVWERDADSNAEIYVMNADGTGAHALTHGCCAGNPAYSPDDKRIAFERDDQTDGTQGVAVMNADGTHVYQVTSNPLSSDPNACNCDEKPHWSPDGKQLAFQRVLAEPTAAVFTVNADGSNRRQLTPWQLGASGPSWSPDGSLILFNGSCCHYAGIVANIYTMRPDGTDIRELSHNPDLRSGSFDASWSPDGRMIAFSHFPNSPTDQHTDLYTMEADGSHVTDITNTPASGDFNREQASWWGTHPTAT
jgi:Tol biopolymer transport system component